MTSEREKLAEWRKLAENFGDKASMMAGDAEARRAYIGELALFDSRNGKKHWELQVRAHTMAQKDEAERRRDPNEPRSKWFSL